MSTAATPDSVTVAPFAMPRATHDRLRARAAADDRSIAATLRMAVELFLGPAEDEDA